MDRGGSQVSATGQTDGPLLGELEARIGYTFDNRDLLTRAVTHRSFANEVSTEVSDNQRLEFLGDAVLGLVIATELFHRDREVDEGALSARQSQLVCEPALAEVARQLELGDYLRLGRGEALSGGRTKPSLLADAYEAVLAAVYLDGGAEAARAVISRLHSNALSGARETSAPNDFKSRLQTHVQSELNIQPRYEIIGESGPAHDKVFTARVVVDDEPLGQGEGGSKKSAEQEAARTALESLGIGVD
jgi:ribonuclease-3